MLTLRRAAKFDEAWLSRNLILLIERLHINWPQNAMPRRSNLYQRMLQVDAANPTRPLCLPGCRSPDEARLRAAIAADLVLTPRNSPLGVSSTQMAVKTVPRSGRGGSHQPARKRQLINLRCRYERFIPLRAVHSTRSNSPGVGGNATESNAPIRTVER